MIINNETTNKWDVFDVMMAHEDSYTNFLKYLFENSVEFRNNLSMRVFNKSIPDLVFITRTVFNRTDSNNTKKKDVPDIILFNKNHFCIIEVKVNASEGDAQTERYFNSSNHIKESLNINSDSEDAFYFLTLRGAEPDCKAFKSLTWSDIGECLPKRLSADDNMGNVLLEQLKERIKSISGVIIERDSNWCEVVGSTKWEGAINLFNALKLMPSFENCYETDWWADYKAASKQSGL